jgi:hypothetical protein
MKLIKMREVTDGMEIRTVEGPPMFIITTADTTTVIRTDSYNVSKNDAHLLGLDESNKFQCGK